MPHPTTSQTHGGQQGATHPHLSGVTYFDGADLPSLEAFENSYEAALAKAGNPTGDTIGARIIQAVRTTKAGAERTKALKAIRWVLQSQGGAFAVLCGMDCALTPDVDSAIVFDGRDGEKMKAAFWSAQLGQPMTPTLL